MPASERSQRIRERAYQIWEEQGRPEGLHAQHWYAAEQELEEDESEDQAQGSNSTAGTIHRTQETP
jgi:hypothetical protein